MTPETMDSVFQALAHGTRRRILDIIRAHPGCSVNDVSDHFKTSRIAVMKHLRFLEQAGLLHSTKRGRVRSLYFNGAPIQAIYDRWTTEYSGFWAEKVLDLKYRVESRATPPSAQPTPTAPIAPTIPSTPAKPHRRKRDARH